MGDETELDIKDMLTNFETEARKYTNIAQKINSLAQKFNEKSNSLEDLKKSKKKGEEMRLSYISTINNNRFQEMKINQEYLEAFHDLAIRQLIYELRLIKKEIDYLWETQK
jgi:hypothetical protein